MVVDCKKNRTGNSVKEETEKDEIEKRKSESVG